MASTEAMYFKPELEVPLDGQASQRSTGSSFFKVGMVLLGGSCLALLSIVAIFAYGPTLPSTNEAEATTLLGLPSSLRTPSRMIPQTMANRLPGPSPWKELALAGIQDANRCGRDVSTSANSVKAVLASLSAKDRAAVNVVARAVEEEQVKEEILNVPKKPEDVLKAGATGPLGFWDPLGISTNLPAGRLLFYREVELKHGRICMLASLGILVAEKFHPLFGGDIDVPAYIAWQAIPISAFWIAVSAAIAIPEVGYSIPTFNTPSDGDAYIDAYTFTMKLNRVPGDLNFDPLGLKPADEKEFLEMQNKEINNGRLAMIATAGMIAQELVTGQKVFP